MTSPLPRTGDVVHVRQRRWLVHDVVPGEGLFQSTAVKLFCLDDDAAGEAAEVLWDQELDAVLLPDVPKLVKAGAELDDPAVFGAYLHALRWNTVTSTDKRLLQAPFRAGIALKPYQLEPLRKALELPRVNLFIADDVGLGKTIEAGLVLQELLLRQRVDRVLIVAPPAVTLQWQEELEQRFGLSFVLYDADYVSARRRERGFRVNPWTTHNRFIVSYNRLRGTKGKRGNQHLELLLQSLGTRADRSLLILDECHQVAPATGSLYPSDSRTTRAIREVSERFEHRLFLSATPHNGHSSSFASLLHLLDPQRFTRGVPIHSAKELAPVMVRRLKRHLRGHVPGLPERHLVDHVLDVPADAPELVLAHKLAEYDRVYRAALSELPPGEQASRGLVLVNLHKRLLSSVTAFHNTLKCHATGAAKTLAALKQIPIALAPKRDTDDDVDEDALDEEEVRFMERQSFDAGAQAKVLLDELLTLSARHRESPDARLHQLAAWLNEHLCPGGRWTDERVVLFTEYEHTLGWLRRALPSLLQGDPTGRIDAYTGRIQSERREELKAAFNADPAQHPLRILLATDAAREGINLQAHCKHLFHFDLPWNPSRIEQRNGRIDRLLQPSEHVYCHYFVLPARPEDRVLDYLVKKLHNIREELGSLSEVISARLAAQLDAGLRTLDADAIERLATADALALQAQLELEGEGAEQLRGDLELLGRQLDASRRAVDYRSEHLRALVDLGLRLRDGDLTTGGLQPTGDGHTFVLPPLDQSWSAIVDPMRRKELQRRRFGEPPPVRPITFAPLDRLDAEHVQLHLGHPLVKRLLARFRAQGVAAHDLSRVTALRNPRDTSRRVVMFGRLSLFGHGATRLHEQLLAVAARVTPTGLEPFGDVGEQTTIEWLEEALAHGPAALDAAPTRRELAMRASQDSDRLWQQLEPLAREAQGKAAGLLATRAAQEADAMTELLLRQRKTIEATLHRANDAQQALLLAKAEQEERAQFERDRRFMEQRLGAIGGELQSEPQRIRTSYDVVLRRFEPVGLAYLWPEG